MLYKEIKKKMTVYLARYTIITWNLHTKIGR